VTGLRATDPLSRVVTEVSDLLGRIDHVLVHYGVCTGYPDHPRLLAALRDFGALPGDVFAHLREVDPASLSGAAVDVGEVRDGYRRLADRLDRTAGGLYWGGPAREAFNGYWAPLAGYLSGGPVSMVDTIAATAQRGEAIAAWWYGIRGAVVTFFRAVMANGIAVVLRGVEVDPHAGAPVPTEVLGPELPEIDGFDRVGLAASHGADLFLGAVGAAVRAEPARPVPVGELPYRDGGGGRGRDRVAGATGDAWVSVGELDAVDG
jgi:hypothetical protein